MTMRVKRPSGLWNLIVIRAEFEQTILLKRFTKWHLQNKTILKGLHEISKQFQMGAIAEMTSLTFFLFYASHEWISSIANVAATDWIVVHNLTFCILTASTRARVLAFLIDARFILGTFRAQYTFGSTIGRRTNIAWYTRAYCMIV